VAARPEGARRRWYVVLSVYFVGSLLIVRSFTDLGHLVAWVLGVSLAVLVSRAGRVAAGGPGGS
jgi:hypothetical protein